MKFVLATLIIVLPGICGAQQQKCVGYGCPPTQASVSDLLEASRANKSPGISFAEGAAKGFAQGMELRRQQEELKQLQEQREQLQRERERLDQVSQARTQETPPPTAAPAATFWDPTTVQGLMERCRNGNDYDEGLCDGVFSAWMESFIVAGKKPQFCFPAGTSVPMSQMKAVYIQWAERNPAKWHLSSLGNLSESMKEAFPCPKKSNKQSAAKNAQ